MPLPLQSLAKAKVNLALDVLEKRPDGFHNIDTVFYEIDLADDISFEPIPESIIQLVVEDGAAPEGDENIIVRAVEALPKRSGSTQGLKITLRKRIPMQAGLGGGSSNAAAALQAAGRLLDYQGPLDDIAAELGSDVVFFLTGKTARGRGQGQEISPIETQHVFHLLIVKPKAGVPTAWAYEELDKDGMAGKHGFAGRVQKALEEGDRAQVLASMGNDFEQVVIRRFPEIGRLKDRLRDAGAEAALLCGSGSAVFGVFPSRGQAERAGQLFADVWHAAASGCAGRAPALAGAREDSL